MNKQIQIFEVKKLLADGKKVKVKTLNGEYTEITNFVEKGVLPTVEVFLENGNSIKTTPNHRFFSNSGWLQANQLVPNKTLVLCLDNNEQVYSAVKDVKYLGKYPIVDITVEHPEHCYYGNNILNHNTGKSYLAGQIAASAQKQGFDVFYFDSERGTDTSFLVQSGCDINALGYIPTENVETLFDTIESIVVSCGKENKLLFIWDSLAMTPALADQEGDWDPNSSVAVKARVISKGLQKLVIPLANANATLLILNQLKDNVGGYNPKFPILKDRYSAPGGKAVSFASTIRVWLVKPQSKDSFILDEKGYRIGSTVKAHIIKSRKGCEGRECRFKILWGDAENVGVQDEESWFDVAKESSHLTSGGAWFTLKYEDGEEKKFQKAEWVSLLKTDEKFRERVLFVLEEELVTKFDKREVDASRFYTEEEIGEE